MSRFDDLRKAAGIEPIGTSKKQEKPTLKPINLSTREVTPVAPESVTPIEPRPVRPTRIMETPSMDITKSPLLQTIKQANVPHTPIQDIIAQGASAVANAPVIKPALHGLGKAINYIENLPGIKQVGGALSGAYKTVAEIPSVPSSDWISQARKNIANLATSTSGLAPIETGIQDIISGAMNPEAAKAKQAEIMASRTQGLGPVSKFGYEALTGTATSPLSLIPAAIPGTGKGLQVLRDLANKKAGIVAEDIAKNAIRNVSETARTPVTSPFREGAAVTNPIARGYTEQVARTFEPTGVSALDRLRASRVTTAEPTPVSPTVAPQATAEVPKPKIQQAVTPNEQMAFDYIRVNPTVGTSEIQKLFKLGYTDIQKLKDAALNDIPYKGLGGKPSPITRVPTVELTPTGAVGAPQAAEVPTVVQRAQVPTQPTTRQPGERGFVKTLEESGKLTPGVTQGLKTSTERAYEQITNIETVHKATQRIARGIDKAESDLIGKKSYNAEDVATGMRLIDEFQKTGFIERAVTMAENLSKRLTEAGQTVQAASIWNRLTPEGALLAAQRKVNRINENLLTGQKEVKITPEQAQNITDAAGAIQSAGASKERAGTVMEIMDRVRKGEEVTAADKQIISDFVADAKRFINPSEARPPRPASVPKEMKDARVRDRVTSFLEAQEQAAKERLRAKGIQISSNPIDVWTDYAYIGALKLAKGAIKFADFGEQMIKDFGEDVRPHLRNIYEKSQEVLNQSTKKINEQVVSQAERVAESYLKKNEANLASGDISLIRDLAQKVSSLSGIEQRAASQELQSVLNGFEKAGIWKKISSAQYISMLLNPKTQARNIIGNDLMYRLERLQRLISTPIDIAASKITGGPRTITFKSGPSVWDDFFTTSKDFFSGAVEGGKAGAKGVSAEGLMSKYEIGSPAFTSKYNPLTYAERALGAVMKGADFAAYQRSVNQRMREMAYLDAINKGIKGDDAIRGHIQTFMTNLDDSVHNIAKEYGKFATFQNDSALARKLMGFRGGLNVITTGSKEFGVGSLVVPFTKTPANLLLRGLDYSPIGILKATKQAYDILKKPNTDLTRADVIQSVSRAIIGSGMGALAYWLADKGAMWGQSNADPEVRKLMQQTGVKDFQINGSAFSRMLEAMTTGGNIKDAAKIRPGDKLWTYEWAQPSSMPMAIGSNVYQGTKNDQGILKTTGEAAASGLGTLFNSSVLSGIREAFQIPPGEDNAVKAIGLNLIKQAPGMFTPSILRNVNTFLDDRIKETYNPDDIQSILSPAAANIPGLSQQMPQRVSTLGQPQTRPNNFFDVFVSPSDRSKYEPTKEAQFVIDLMQATGENNLAPRAVQKYLKGKAVGTKEEKKVDLSPEQYVRLQTIVGQETAKRISKINQNLPTDKKVEAVIKALDEAGKIGRNELKKEVGIQPTK